MLKDSISNIFDFIPETNITEEYFYEHRGDYPVFSGQTKDLGIVAFIDSYNQHGNCITFTTYGINAGKLFYRDGKYTIGRNCMGLKLKDKYKKNINLEWFSFMFQNLFYKLRIGDQKGQRSLNKKLIENVQVSIPDKSIQDSQLKFYKNYLFKSDYVDRLLKDVKNLLKSKFKIINDFIEETIGNVFNIDGGNSGLTEEFTYYNQPRNEDKRIPILSSATLKTNLMGYISDKAKPNNRNIKIFRSPSILVARNGYAGTMTFINGGKFTTNDHAYVLTLKKEWTRKINLRWFACQFQEMFYNLVTSKSDNATFNKNYAEQKVVRIPSIEYQNRIGDKLVKVDNLIQILESFNDKKNELLRYEIK